MNSKERALDISGALLKLINTKQIKMFEILMFFKRYVEM